MVSTHRKVPLVFECEGDQLVGVLTLPVAAEERTFSALITLPAGGPQYRVGLGRQLLKQAEYFAGEELATLRFDYRGIGDSDGEFQGFDSVVPDLEAAIAAIKAEIPELKNIIFWGGCNAASAIMMHAWRFPSVKAIIVSNPYLGKHNLSEKAKWLHIFNRLKQKSFWVKLFNGKYDIRSYFSSIEALKKKLKNMFSKSTSLKTNKELNTSFTSEAAPSSANNKPGYVLEQMLNGLTRYRGKCLLFLSENSIQSNEFIVLLKTTQSWRRLFKRPTISILSLPGADQNISSLQSQKTVRKLTGEWLKKFGYIQY